MKSAIMFFAGMGFYFLAQSFVEWNTRRGETLAASACVTQTVNGRFVPVKCAGPK